MDWKLLSRSQCVEESNCTLPSKSIGEYSAISGLRIITSLLSIIGALSIILSAIAKRQVTSQKVHPIFMLSIADMLLAMMWLVGGGITLHGAIDHHAVCFIITAVTLVLECVTINLTLVYALYAYAHVMRTNLNTLMNGRSMPDHGWTKTKVVTVYFTAWIIPLFLVIVPFTVIGISRHIFPDANNCSCWCLPKFANILPIPTDRSPTHASEEYILSVKKLGITSSSVILSHYVVVFPLLVFYYVNILRRINKMKKDNNEATGSRFYGATGTVLVQSHSRAKQRVVLFLSVFVITGFFNLLLAFILMVHLSVVIRKRTLHGGQPLRDSMMAILFIQSITVPLQGFLNAIVYGWTREDFLHVMVSAPGKMYRNVNDVTPTPCTDDGDLDDTLLTESESSVHNLCTPQTPLSQAY